MTLYDVTHCTVVFFPLLWRKLTWIAISWTNGDRSPKWADIFYSRKGSERLNASSSILSNGYRKGSGEGHELTFPPPCSNEAKKWLEPGLHPFIRLRVFFLTEWQFWLRCQNIWEKVSHISTFRQCNSKATVS